MGQPGNYLDLYDYRLQVRHMYQERNDSLYRGEDPSAVLQRFRERRDRLFATHPQSALAPEQRKEFRALSYFPYNPEARVDATMETDVEPQQLSMETSTEEAMPMRRVAAAHFIFDGHPLRLYLYWIEVYGGGLFLPFRDTTSPAESYGGGRYLFDTVKGSDFLQLPDQAGKPRIVLDFNYAYNPSCAYNYRWSCPLAPPENRLPVPVRAGERKFA